jgi:hypothetical protein
VNELTLPESNEFTAEVREKSINCVEFLPDCQFVTFIPTEVVVKRVVDDDAVDAWDDEIVVPKTTSVVLDSGLPVKIGEEYEVSESEVM